MHLQRHASQSPDIITTYKVVAIPNKLSKLNGYDEIKFQEDDIMSMFCYQCQEAAKGAGCSVKGVC
ncbi:MAG: hypothetical protein Q8O06_01175, partial [Acetobacterium sp.]|nr:hypothetical protein [Acetobacterium sp.]